MRRYMVTACLAAAVTFALFHAMQPLIAMGDVTFDPDADSFYIDPNAHLFDIDPKVHFFAIDWLRAVPREGVRGRVIFEIVKA